MQLSRLGKLVQRRIENREGDGKDLLLVCDRCQNARMTGGEERSKGDSKPSTLRTSARPCKCTRTAEKETSSNHLPFSSTLGLHMLKTGVNGERRK